MAKLHAEEQGLHATPSHRIRPIKSPFSRAMSNARDELIAFCGTDTMDPSGVHVCDVMFMQYATGLAQLESHSGFTDW
jgi:hypothetical protein